MVSAAIVLFNENLETLKKTVDSFLEISIEKKLYLIDNSPINLSETYFNHPEIEYIFVGKNIGFGKAHNLVLHKINTKFHLILNPDVEFKSHVIPSLINELENNPQVSFVTPKVKYPNNKAQYICRKHPTFFDLINRRITYSKSKISRNEYRNSNLSLPFNPEFIHGCFMLFKTTDFKDLKGFDERYFLYMEDADLCRKIEVSGKKILYYPKVEVVHQHQKGSSKKVKLFFYHLSSAFKYFYKWGF